LIKLEYDSISSFEMKKPILTILEQFFLNIADFEFVVAVFTKDTYENLITFL
jgi:hypothetical protein